MMSTVWVRPRLLQILNKHSFKEVWEPPFSNYLAPGVKPVISAGSISLNFEEIVSFLYGLLHEADAPMLSAY